MSAPAPTRPVSRRRRRRALLGAIVAVAVLAVVGLCCTTTPSGPPRSLVLEGPLRGLTLDLAFPNLTFERPVFLTWAPDGEDRLFVLEQHGVIRVFENVPDVDRTEVFLDISERVSRAGNEEGLLGLAFHPDFARNGELFIYYSATAGGGALPIVGGRSILSRFRVGPDGKGDPASEEPLLSWDQPYRNQNGGHIAFGPDGMLYVGLGDGGLWGDPDDNAQDLSTLLGAILRIDVDRRDEGKAYAIPPDNPFVGREGAAGEIWAYGLRNPWRFAFDRLTGELWTADVGQDAWEEVDLILRGGNYGWPAWEGYAVYEADDVAKVADPIPPLATYGHDQGKSITGGYVYRGPTLRKLDGAYIYADYVTGTVWALRRSADAALTPGMPSAAPGAPLPTALPGVDITRLVDSRLPIASFGEDRDGELYLCAFDGKIYRFTLGGRLAPPMPELLSQTGLFASVPDLRPAPGAIAYEVNVPLWSDDAPKARFLVLPPGGQIGYRDDGAWHVPPGTRLVKTFFHEEVRGDPSSRRRLETRVIRRDDETGWTAVTYVWNPAQDEATKLTGSATRTLRTAERDGRATEQTWYFPSQQNCIECHTRAAGFLLGVRTPQLNRAGPDGGANQIDALVDRGVVSGAPGPAGELPRHPALEDRTVAVDRRVRAYLAENCAFCHMPGAPGNATIDLRHDTPLASTRMIDQPPGQGDLGLGETARIVAPGDPERSVLWQRMARRGDDRAMPPLASVKRHEAAVALIAEWIRGLKTGEAQKGASGSGQ